MIVVVLGMHRSGTSLVANVLHHLGVHMGDRLLGANEWNPCGHWEDLDFFELNVDLLRAAGGDWANPPGEMAVQAVGEWFRLEMRNLVGWKNGQGRKAWGFKDPRTALTILLWHPVLMAAAKGDLYYVHTVRDEGAVVASLMRRAQGAAAEIAQWVEEGRATEEEAAGDLEMAEWGEDAWRALVHEYERRVAQFLAHAKPAVITVAFENLVDPERKKQAVARLAGFVGVEGDEVIEAAGVIVSTDGATDKRMG